MPVACIDCPLDPDETGDGDDPDGRRVPAREGFELGFVTEVVPDGQALQAAKRWAAMILECSPKAVRASKQAAYQGLDEPTLEQAMRTVYPAQKENTDSQDYVEGPRALPKSANPMAKQIADLPGRTSGPEEYQSEAKRDDLGLMKSLAKQWLSVPAARWKRSGFAGRLLSDAVMNQD